MIVCLDQPFRFYVFAVSCPLAMCLLRIPSWLCLENLASTLRRNVRDFRCFLLFLFHEILANSTVIYGTYACSGYMLIFKSGALVNLLLLLDPVREYAVFESAHQLVRLLGKTESQDLYNVSACT